MTYEKFKSLCADSLECDTLELFSTECGGSLPADYFDGNADPVKALSFIWDYSHSPTFDTVFQASGLSQSAFSRCFGIPLRTIQDWVSGARKTCDYVVNLLAYCVTGIISDNNIDIAD